MAGDRPEQKGDLGVRTRSRGLAVGRGGGGAAAVGRVMKEKESLRVFLPEQVVTVRLNFVRGWVS